MKNLKWHLLLVLITLLLSLQTHTIYGLSCNCCRHPREERGEVLLRGVAPKTSQSRAPPASCTSRFPKKYSSSRHDRRLRRRQLLLSIVGSTFLAVLAPTGKGLQPQASFAAETVGKDPNCNDASCLGVWDGLLADCPHGSGGSGGGGAGCASSQDDTPGIFAEPWDYSDSPNYSLEYSDQMKLLIPAIQSVCRKRGDGVEILLEEGRYLRVLFTDGKTKEKSIGEFYFTPNDTTVQFRVGAVRSKDDDDLGFSTATAPTTLWLSSGSMKNLERCELIRKELRYTKVPVLRNRKRALFFVESDFDSFGPGSAALGPPAEMSTGELEGRQDVDPRLKIDSVQRFPFVAK